MAKLELNDWGVRCVVKQFALKPANRLGRGTFSAVYRDDTTNGVLKLTIDPTAWEIHHSGRFYGASDHLPRGNEIDHYVVGENNAGNNIYLFGAEFLTPIHRSTHSAVAKRARRMVRYFGDRGFWSKQSSGQLRLFSEAHKAGVVTDEEHDALYHLNNLATDMEAKFDIHAGNIMVREDTGEIVLNDLLFAQSVHPAWERRRCGD